MIQPLYTIVVNWNLKEDTINCVESLFAAGTLAGQVVVVDNGSSDGSVETIRKRFSSSVHLIANEKNLGFGGGSNLGITFALECGANRVLILNNDTYVAPTFLRELEQAVHADDHYAIFGPVILFHDSPERIWYFGDRLLPGLLATNSLYRRQNDREDFPPIVSVDFISGCCMLIKRDVFEAIGLFDASYFMYGEDVDFCWRARRAGFRLAVATRAKMWHKVSLSAKRDQPTSRYLRIRNQNRFYRMHARGFQFPVMFAFSWLRTIRTGLDDLIHARFRSIAPLFRGWIDGWWKSTASDRAG